MTMYNSCKSAKKSVLHAIKVKARAYQEAFECSSGRVPCDMDTATGFRDDYAYEAKKVRKAIKDAVDMCGQQDVGDYLKAMDKEMMAKAKEGDRISLRRNRRR